MFCNRRVNNRINKLYERALRLVYGDYATSFSVLLAQYGSFTVHHTNIQTLLLEMYKIKQNLSESCLNVLFSAVNDNHNLRSQSHLRVPHISTVFYSANSIEYFESVI